MPTLCQRKGGGTHRQTHYETHARTTRKHATTNTQHTRLEADAVLISVTAAEPLAAQITAGVQTLEGRGCLHKGEHRNKGFMGYKHPLA